MPQVIDESAFPILTPAELKLLRPLASEPVYASGALIFHSGTAELDLFVVEEGGIEIRNPFDNNSVITVHRIGGFAGDIDLLTGRPVIVCGYADGPTRLLRVPHRMIRALLNRVPSFGEKLMIAFTRRRELLSKSGKLGITVVGAGYCKDTNLVREFLYKNFVPFQWLDSEHEAGRKAIAALGPNRPRPIVDCGEGKILFNPTLREIAKCAGIWRTCPGELVDLAVIGAGPAGIAAAVYAASEGVSTLLLDRLGPGGQAGGSSKIENFIGFPAGLSGTELATRGVLQVLKFGARMVAPVVVDRLELPADPHAPRLLHLDCGTTVRARVVLIATGVSWRRLQAVGAERFESAGIHYVCTGVEAELYDKFDVVVVGGGNSAGQATMHLAECCPSRQVHLIVRSPLGSGMSDYLVSRIRGAENVRVHEGAEIVEIEGSHHLESIVLENKTSGNRQHLACAGVFVFIGANPSCGWLPPELARDDHGYILTGSDALRTGRWPLTDRDPCPLETTMPGVLAAGDVRAGSTKRVGFAVGDGSLAVTCTHHLMSLG